MRHPGRIRVLRTWLHDLRKALRYGYRPLPALWEAHAAVLGYERRFAEARAVIERHRRG